MHSWRVLQHAGQMVLACSVCLHTRGRSCAFVACSWLLCEREAERARIHTPRLGITHSLTRGLGGLATRVQ